MKPSTDQAARMVALLRPELLRVEAALAAEVRPGPRSELQLRRANLRARVRALNEDALDPPPPTAEAAARAAVQAAAARRKANRARLRAGLQAIGELVPAGTSSPARGEHGRG